ncbi:MAG: ATP-binding protein [Yoonia sp.]|nr:ATP-binding protein [Yoonia sp.]
MAEGSGFLQWLSVFALALDPEIDVILLDEPDAHLHSSMQTLLISELEKIAATKEKQVLLATHSTEILRWANHQTIFKFENSGAKYLSDDEGKIGLFAGLGSDYSPRLDRLKKTKALLIVEGQSDAKLIKSLANKLGVPISDDVVIWPSTASSKERRQLFEQLKKDIPELKAVSIRDRDNTEQNQVDATNLRDKSEKYVPQSPLDLCVWQRRHIENYLIFPATIARVSGHDIDDVCKALADHHAIVIPPNFTDANVPPAINDAHGKEIFEKGPHSIEKQFGVSKFDVCEELQQHEICQDLVVLVKKINAMITP